MPSNTHSLFALLALLLLTPPTTAQVPPYTLDTFRSVLSRAKLQTPTSSDAIFDLSNFANENFQLTDNRYMQFRMSGKGRRTELRQMREDGDNYWFDVSGSHRMRAAIALPTPEPSMRSFTFMQTLCYKDGRHHQAVAVSYSGGSDGNDDAISASVAFSESPSSRRSQFLVRRSAAANEYVLEINSSRVRIFYNGSEVLDEDLSFWEGYDCYFKAGVYVHEPDDLSVFARTKFVELEWP